MEIKTQNPWNQFWHPWKSISRTHILEGRTQYPKLKFWESKHWTHLNWNWTRTVISFSLVMRRRLVSSLSPLIAVPSGPCWVFNLLLFDRVVSGKSRSTLLPPPIKDLDHPRRSRVIAHIYRPLSVIPFQSTIFFSRYQTLALDL